MGRKPNSLILHYFNRGAKLQDSSNRYQHTCKACGETFPKGRIDSLQNHLTKKCPALSMQERTNVILQIHNVLGASTGSKAEKKIKEHRPSNLPAPAQTPQQTFDGLNVLAEASRQVGQVERRGSQTYPAATGAGDDPMHIALDHAIDPTLDAVFPSHFPNTFDELGSFSQASGTLCGNRDVNFADHLQGHPSNNAIASLPPFPPLPTEHTDDEHAHVDQGPTEPTEVQDLHMSSQPDRDLSTIAADANELLPDQQTQPIDQEVQGHDINGSIGAGPTNVDGSTDVPRTTGASDHNIQLENMGSSPHAGPPGDPTRHSDQWQINFDGPNYQAFYEEMQKATETTPEQPQQSTPMPRSIAVRDRPQGGEFTEFSVGSGQPKQTTRQRFSADRRKEVQDVRKKGACLRCRMLRKPCSSETPCGTCRSVDSARVWKEPCMRVRLPDLFDLYTAGLHSCLAYRDVNIVKSQLQFEHLHGQIQANHFGDSSMGISFKASQGRVDGAAVGVQLLASENVSVGAQEVKLIDGEGEDLVNKLGSYLEAYGPALQENEPSHFMRSSLAAMSDMYEETKVRSLPNTPHVAC